MKSFKFLQQKERAFTTYMDLMDDYHLGRIHTPSIQLQITPMSPMRWVDINGFNFHYRVFTHLDMLEVQRIVSETIIPFLYETNNYENRTAILNLLGARFHRAQLNDTFEFNGTTISTTHETV